MLALSAQVEVSGHGLSSKNAYRNAYRGTSPHISACAYKRKFAAKKIFCCVTSSGRSPCAYMRNKGLSVS